MKIFYLINDSLQVIALTIVGLEVKCEWGLTPFWVSFLQLAYNCGMFLGLALSFLYTNRFGRKPLCLISTIACTVVGLLSGKSMELWHLVVCRLLLGFFCSMGVGPTVSLGGEVIPMRFRAIGFSGPSLAWGVGGAIACLLGYFVEEQHGWRGLLIAIALVFSPAIPFFAVIRESPRYNVSRGNYAEAEKTIESLYRMNGKHAGHISLIRDSNSLGKVGVKSKTASLYTTLRSSTGMFLNLLVLSLSSLFAYYGHFGYSYAAPRFFNEGYCTGSTVPVEETCTFEKTVLVELGIVNLADPLGVLLILVMLDFVGRRKTFFMVVVVASISVAALFLCLGPTYLVFWSVLGRMLMGPIAFIPGILTAEYFPTEIRSFAVSCQMAFGNVGSILGIYSAQAVYNLSPALFLGLTLGQTLLIGVCLLVLKKETKNTELE